jgi:hypothetical protein
MLRDDTIHGSSQHLCDCQSRARWHASRTPDMRRCAFREDNAVPVAGSMCGSTHWLCPSSSQKVSWLFRPEGPHSGYERKGRRSAQFQAARSGADLVAIFEALLRSLIASKEVACSNDEEMMGVMLRTQVYARQSLARSWPAMDFTRDTEIGAEKAPTTAICPPRTGPLYAQCDDIETDDMPGVRTMSVEAQAARPLELFFVYSAELPFSQDH